MAVQGCCGQFDPSGGGDPFQATSSMPAPGEVATQDQGQPQRQVGLSTTASAGEVGPIVGWVRSSPYTEEELRLMVNALSLAVIALVAVHELRGN